MASPASCLSFRHSGRATTMNQTDVNFLDHWPRGTFSFADAGQFEWGVAVFWIAVGRKTGAFFIIRLFIFTLLTNTGTVFRSIYFICFLLCRSEFINQKEMKRNKNVGKCRKAERGPLSTAAIPCLSSARLCCEMVRCEELSCGMAH